MLELQVIVELDNEQYLGSYNINKPTSAQQSTKIIKDIISDILEEFETTKLTIKVYNEVVFRKGKTTNTTTLYNSGDKYQKLVNLYNNILMGE